MSDHTMIKLNEEQMRDFVANGYISLKLRSARRFPPGDLRDHRESL